MHHNLSVHSQPSSVPVNEQNILSPIPPSDVSPPSMENNMDQKPDVQNLSITDKAMDTSLSGATNVDTTDNAVRPDFKSNNQRKQTESQSKDNLKRPALLVQDCESLTDDDCSMNQVLYDYSTWDAW